MIVCGRGNKQKLMLVFVASSHIEGYPGGCIALGCNLYPYTINPQAIFHITRGELDRQEIALYPSSTLGLHPSYV
jgi:hypothetical protein